MQITLDDNGDALIKNNKLQLTKHNSDEEISQRLKQALLFFYGEWFLDVTAGVPWFQVILEKGTSPDIIEGIIKDVIIGVQGVVYLNRFNPIEYEPETRRMRISFDVTTINGNNLQMREVLP